MKISWKTCFKVAASIFILFLAVTYWGAFATFAGKLIGAASPLILGCIIAYPTNILMSFFERHYFPTVKFAPIRLTRRPFCLVLSFATLAAIATVIVKLIVPQLVAVVMLIINSIPPIVEFVTKKLNEIPSETAHEIVAFLEATDWKSQFENIFHFLSEGLVGLFDMIDTIIQLITGVFSIIVTIIIGFIFAIYLLFNKNNLSRQFDLICESYLSEKAHIRVNYILHVLNVSFHRFIVGQCTEACILGLLCVVGLSVLKLPEAGMISALIAFSALIPIAGAYIGAALGSFIILINPGSSPVDALIFLAFIVILQQFEGNIIYPKVVGSSMGLPGIWVLAAVTLGGGVFGIGGMLLGVPLTAAAYRILRHDVRERRIAKRIKLEEAEALAEAEAMANMAEGQAPESHNHQ